MEVSLLFREPERGLDAFASSTLASLLAPLPFFLCRDNATVASLCGRERDRAKLPYSSPRSPRRFETFASGGAAGVCTEGNFRTERRKIGETGMIFFPSSSPLPPFEGERRGGEKWEMMMLSARSFWGEEEEEGTKKRRRRSKCNNKRRCLP